MASVSAATRRLEERLDRIEQLLIFVCDRVIGETPAPAVGLVEEEQPAIADLMSQFKGN